MLKTNWEDIDILDIEPSAYTQKQGSEIYLPKA